MRTIDELQERRKELGLTYAELSERSGVPLGTVQKVLSRQTTSPRFSTLRKLEIALFGEPEQSNGNKKESSGIRYGLQEETLHMVHEPQAAYAVSPSFLPEEDLLLAGGQEKGGDILIGDMGRDLERLGYHRFSENETWRSIFCKPQGDYTVADYEQIPEDQRYELIDGMLIRMEAPTAEHQMLVVFLTVQFAKMSEEEGCDCLVLCAPFDIQLDRDEKTMVQPDVVVICQEENVNEKRGLGAPDLCIEILSPSTRGKDQLLKKYKYEKAGVREFWVVDPEYQRVIVHNFEKGEENRYSFEEKVPIGICGGEHQIDFSERVPAFFRRRREGYVD